MSDAEPGSCLPSASRPSNSSLGATAVDFNRFQSVPISTRDGCSCPYWSGRDRGAWQCSRPAPACWLATHSLKGARRRQVRRVSHAGEVPFLQRDLLRRHSGHFQYLLLVGPNAQAPSPELAPARAVLDPIAALEGLLSAQMPRLRSVLAQGLAAVERVDVHLDLNSSVFQDLKSQPCSGRPSCRCWCRRGMHDCLRHQRAPTPSPCHCTSSCPAAPAISPHTVPR